MQPSLAVLSRGQGCSIAQQMAGCKYTWTAGVRRCMPDVSAGGSRDCAKLSRWLAAWSHAPVTVTFLHCKYMRSDVMLRIEPARATFHISRGEGEGGWAAPAPQPRHSSDKLGLCLHMQEYALEHVMLGDEPAARAALQQKAAVADALSQATCRAEANSALAR